MSEEEAQAAESPPGPGVGDTLRNAREAKGLTLEQVASETRISIRHLEQIEAGAFENLPGRTYAVGFAKTYAKMVGLDQGDIADQVREEMELEPITQSVGTKFEPGEAARGPSGKLVWFSIFAVVLLLAGLFFAGRTIFGGEVEWDSLVEDEPVAAETPAAGGDDDAAAPPVEGPVVFTAEEVVWVRFTDAAGLLLMEKEMAAGESYTVPADADGPMVITGRPDLLAITIGGQSVPKLSNDPVTVVDAPVSAAALLARDEEALAEEAETTASASPSPARVSRPRPSASPSAAPADAESAAEPPAPSFVSEPVVQEVAPQDAPAETSVSETTVETLEDS